MPGHDVERERPFLRTSPIAVVMHAVAPIMVTQPRPIAADLARAVIGPDHPAVTARIGVGARVVVMGRCGEPRVKMMMPVMRRCAIPAVTDPAGAKAAAVEGGC